jgi:branched-chain amino acid transport system permease protein
LTFDIALLLAQDGLTNGAIYALLALALVLVFAVTRIIFVPQGEFVAYGALTLASLQLGKVPGTAYLLAAAGVAAAAVEVVAALREHHPRRIPAAIGWNVVLPVALLLVTRWVAPQQPPLWAQVALAVALVVPLGPILYRLAFQPLANASVLVLLIVSVAVHFVMVGLGLLFFGAEGSRTPAFSEARFEVGAMTVSGQSLFVIGASLGLIVALYLFFERTLYGKALRATAVNRLGARLVGISTTLAGKLTFTLAALIGAASGILVAPITTIYYDSGFLIGLKGFVGAIIGGLVSYPLAAMGALIVGLLESFSSFWASAFKEVIVFTLIIPVLLWRSLTTRHVEEEEDE